MWSTSDAMGAERHDQWVDRADEANRQLPKDLGQRTSSQPEQLQWRTPIRHVRSQSVRDQTIEPQARQASIVHNAVTRHRTSVTARPQMATVSGEIDLPLLGPANHADANPFDDPFQDRSFSASPQVAVGSDEFAPTDRPEVVTVPRILTGAAEARPIGTAGTPSRSVLVRIDRVSATESLAQAQQNESDLDLEFLEATPAQEEPALRSDELDELPPRGELDPSTLPTPRTDIPSLQPSLDKTEDQPPRLEEETTPQPGTILPEQPGATDVLAPNEVVDPFRDEAAPQRDLLPERDFLSEGDESYFEREELPCDRVYNNRNCCQQDLDCKSALEALRLNSIDTISLDITPSFAPNETDPTQVEQERVNKLSATASRVWLDRTGQVLAEGKFNQFRFGNVYVTSDDGGEVTIPFRRLGDDERCFVAAWWNIPVECRLSDEAPTPRDWQMTTFTWTASALCHKPLYFEDVQLERYGHSAGPIRQPVLSGAHFFVNFVLLPYNVGLHPPNECLYALGYYRPGSCAPWLLPAFPLSFRGAAYQAIAVTGIAAIIP